MLRHKAETGKSPEACEPASLMHTVVNNKETQPHQTRKNARTDATHVP